MTLHALPTVDEYREELESGACALGEPMCSRIIEGKQIARDLYPGIPRDDSLADIEHFIRRALHKIKTGARWKGLYLFTNCLKTIFLFVLTHPTILALR